MRMIEKVINLYEGSEEDWWEGDPFGVDQLKTARENVANARAELKNASALESENARLRAALEMFAGLGNWTYYEDSADWIWEANSNPVVMAEKALKGE